VLQLLSGTPRVVQANGHKRVWHDVTNLDQIRVRMTWADGREAEFLQSDIAAVRRPKFYVQGTAGTLVGSYRTITLEAIEPGRGYVATQAHHAEAPAELLLARYESGYGISETRLPPALEQPFAFHRNLAADLLDDPEVEAVYIPLPNSLHREWVERAAAAGKHVLCEKPLAPTAADAEAMVATCAIAGVTLLEAYMTPFHPRAKAIEALVASGRLGALRFARAVFTGT